MNLRRTFFFSMVALRGKRIGQYYHSYVNQIENGIPPDTTQKLIIALLDHCKNTVPFYAERMGKIKHSYEANPAAYIRELPILSRDDLRRYFDDLKSKDLPRRKWYTSSSGGSTGLPATFILDKEYEAKSVALTLLYSKLIGKDFGEREIQLWGSTRDILVNRQTLSARLVSFLYNVLLLDVFRMTLPQMERYLAILNREQPRLILAYAQPLYELARFAEQRQIAVNRQMAIMTSAGMLFPFMRETIERVFQCRIYNRYGCREVGDIACERPGMDGLWVAPWGNFLEIVDDDGNPVSDGQEGNILLTCLTNYAMPLVRYSILDRGYLLPREKIPAHISGQVLGDITGRTLDSFRKRDATVITPNYFTQLLYFRPWINKFQVVQKDYEHIVYRFVKTGFDCPQQELNELLAKTRLVMGEGCRVDFEFVSDIPVSGSGKYRFYLSELDLSKN